MHKHSRRNAKIEATATVPGKAKRGQRAKMPKRKAEVLDSLEQINLHAAGIDVGSAENFVCVPASAVKPGQPNVRSFGAFTKQQDDLVEWLKECAITTVAMEATGIYWMSLYDKVEAVGIEVVLVDPHSVRCYELFCDHSFDPIGVIRFLGSWPGWHLILWPNSHASIIAL